MGVQFGDSAVWGKLDTEQLNLELSAGARLSEYLGADRVGERD